jgi:hypothetical protein
MAIDWPDAASSPPPNDYPFPWTPLFDSTELSALDSSMAEVSDRQAGSHRFSFTSKISLRIAVISYDSFHPG